jgi:hypothetical protein
MNLNPVRLIPYSSGSIVKHENPNALIELLGPWGVLGANLAELLRHANGFYAFDSALLVRPLRHQGAPLGIVEWNEANLWKNEFAHDLGDVLFFAEDLFGGQFGIRGKRLCVFDPETSVLEDRYDSLDEWADAVLTDDALSGSVLARSWATKVGELQPGMRLVPKRPFVVGGAYKVDNLYAIDETTAMKCRAAIANQIHDLPDGSEIVLDFPDDDKSSRRGTQGREETP